MLKKIHLNRSHVPVVILVIFGLLFLFIGLFNHYFFKTFTYDYANYNFAFWDYSHFRISPLTTFKGNFLQDHFSFSLMYFIPVYWLLNWLTGTYTLIIIQNVLILVAAWYTHKTIQLKTNNKWLTNGVLVYFFLLLGRYTAFASDVNLAIISACFIPVFIFNFETKKYKIAFIIFILSLFSRENIALWFIFIFIVLIVSGYRDKKAVLFSILGIIISLAYFILLFKVIIPANETPGVEYVLFNYSALGADPGEALSFILRHPFESIKMFFLNHLENPEYDGIKMEFYQVYLISGGFILLFRPQYLIWFIPVVAQKVLNDDPFRWGIATYYSAEVVTLLPLSVFWVLSSLKNNILQKGFALAACTLAVTMTIYKMDAENNKAPWTLFPSKVKFYDHRFYETEYDVRKTYALLEKIPKNARVSSSNNFTPHLAQRKSIYFFPKVKDAEYIVFSLDDNNYLISEAENIQERNKYLLSPEWDIVERAYPVFLLKRRITPSPVKKDLSVIWSRVDTLKCNFENFDHTSNHILYSNMTKADTISHLSDKVVHSGRHSVSLTPEDPYTQAITLDEVKDIESIEFSAWHYGDSEKVFMVLDNKNGYYKSSNTVVESNADGWHKIKLNCRLIEAKNKLETIIYVWNSGDQIEYIDDMELIIRYK